MKQKRTFIAVLLVIAVLALGVAYALDAIPLSIKGQATSVASTANFQVEFTASDVETVEAALAEGVDEDGKTIEVNNVTASGTAASFAVTGMSSEGDTAVVTFTVTNNSGNLAAQLSDLTVKDKSATDIFDCTAAFADGATTLLQPGKSADIVVTVELNETVIEGTTIEDVITVNFTATAQQPA